MLSAMNGSQLWPAAVACALAVFAGSLSTPMAATFDESSGKLVLDGDFGFGFEDGAEALTAFGLERVLPAGPLVVETPDALEGSHVLALGEEVQGVQVSLESAGFEGRRVEIRLWYLAQGRRVVVFAEWPSGSGSYQQTVGRIEMRDTGRATDDGWRELTSGAVDFELAGALKMRELLLLSGMGPGAPDGVVWLDGISISDVGPAKVEATRCNLVNERATCGDGVCHFGVCTDVAQVRGQLPPEVHRADYIARRMFEIETFDGVRRAHVGDTFRSRMMAALDADPRDFWPLVSAAYESTNDGHAQPPLAIPLPRQPLGVCLHLGDADLMPGGGMRPMVFTVDGRVDFARPLEPGDILVEVDGVPFAEWYEEARDRHLFYYTGDPDAEEIQLMPDVIRLAWETGAQMRFQRCEKETPCVAGELVTIEIDTYEMGGASMLEGRAPLWSDQHRICDFRFDREVLISSEEDREGSPTAQDFVRHRDADGIRHVLFNGFPSGPERTEWRQAIEDAVGGGPERIMIDERLGYGGATTQTQWLTGFLIERGRFLGSEEYPWLEQNLNGAVVAAFRQCETRSAGLPAGVRYCGGYPVRFLPGDENSSGSSSGSRLALLTGLDVSNNDVFTEYMSLRRGPTRIFGPGPTWGAFGIQCPLPPYGGEFVTPGFQCTDTWFVTDRNQAQSEFRSGRGVPPDEVVVQRQSDAVAGRDTLIETAREWLEAE